LLIGIIIQLGKSGMTIFRERLVRERLGPEDSERIGQWVHRYYRHLIIQQKYRHHTGEQRRPWRLAELRNRIVHGRYTVDDIQLPEFIAESPNSGIRIGIVIRAQEIDFTGVLPAIYATFDALGCNAGVIIRPQSREPVDEHNTAFGIEVRQFFLDGDYAQDLVDFLNELDLKWSQFKDTLNALLDKQNELKQRSETLKHDLTDILNSGSLYPNDYKPNFEDILTRIKNDFDLNQQLLFQLDELIEDHFRSLHRKELFPIEDLRDIEKRQKNRAEMLEEKEEEIRDIKEEFYSIPSDKNPYVEYGFKINPFSLIVPLERPTMIVNQSESKNIAQEFIEGVIRGSDSNLLLINY